MSEQAPERGRGGNVFSRKIGPLPMWQWFLIALAMVGIYVLYQYRKNNQANANAANTAGGTSTGGTTGAGQVPQFVNQTYTYVAPPTAQPPPPSAHGSKPPPQPAPKPAQPMPGTGPSAGQVYSLPGGTGKGSAPNVTGMTLANAIATLQKAGFGVTDVTYQYQLLPSSSIGNYAQYTVGSTQSAGPNTVAIGLKSAFG